MVILIRVAIFIMCKQLIPSLRRLYSNGSVLLEDLSEILGVHTQTMDMISHQFHIFKKIVILDNEQICLTTGSDRGHPVCRRLVQLYVWV